MDFINGGDNKKSKLMFTAVSKDFSEREKGGPLSTPTIEIPDFQTVYEYFDLENNTKLQLQ